MQESATFVRELGGQPCFLRWSPGQAMKGIARCRPVVTDRDEIGFLGTQQPMAPTSERTALLALFKELRAAEVYLP